MYSGVNSNMFLKKLISVHEVPTIESRLSNCLYNIIDKVKQGCDRNTVKNLIKYHMCDNEGTIYKLE